MNGLHRYTRVRIRQLLRKPASYDNWRVNERDPQIGDIGTCIDLLRADGAPDHYVVEMTTRYGETVWLGEFLREEIEEAA